MTNNHLKMEKKNSSANHQPGTQKQFVGPFPDLLQAPQLLSYL
jgi:hypothetical protein